MNVCKEYNMKRFCLAALTAAVLSACSSGQKGSDSGAPGGDAPAQGLDMNGLRGDWRLASYRIDCATETFEADNSYILSFNGGDNSFGLTTDCNMIGGALTGSGDTIRFINVMVTEMACDNMTVEENMLRLLGDSTAYAIPGPDTLTLTAPFIGSATFVKAASGSLD